MVPDVALPHYRGSSTHVLEVSKSLAARGHNVSVVSRRLSRSQPRREIIDGFETYRTFQGIAFEPPMSSYSPSHVDKSQSSIHKLYFWYLESYRAFQLGVEMATVMAGRGIDVVIERETAFGAGAVLSSVLGVPMILEMIGPRLSAMSLRRARMVLAYSNQMAGGRIPLKKLRIVSSGVNTTLFRPDPFAGRAIRRKYGLEDSFVLGYVGTFQKWHGVNELLSACRKLNSTSMGVKLLLVGPYFAEARRFADELGLSNDITFAGPVPYGEVPAYVNACNVLCAPYNPQLSASRDERGIGAPLKVLEYMACEKPVITTNVPPIPEIIEDGLTGLLVPPGDSGLLAGAIDRLIRDPASADAMAKEARRTAVNNYSWDTFAETLENLLNMVREAPPRAG